MSGFKCDSTPFQTVIILQNQKVSFSFPKILLFMEPLEKEIWKQIANVCLEQQYTKGQLGR